MHPRHNRARSKSTRPPADGSPPSALMLTIRPAMTRAIRSTIEVLETGIRDSSRFERITEKIASGFALVRQREADLACFGPTDFRLDGILAGKLQQQRLARLGH